MQLIGSTARPHRLRRRSPLYLLETLLDSSHGQSRRSRWEETLEASRALERKDHANKGVQIRLAVELEALVSSKRNPASLGEPLLRQPSLDPFRAYPLSQAPA